MHTDDGELSDNAELAIVPREAESDHLNAGSGETEAKQNRDEKEASEPHRHPILLPPPSRSLCLWLYRNVCPHGDIISRLTTLGI